MHSDDLLDELEALEEDDPLRVVVEVHGQQYDIQAVEIEWNAVPSDRLLVIKAR